MFEIYTLSLEFHLNFSLADITLRGKVPEPIANVRYQVKEFNISYIFFDFVTWTFLRELASFNIEDNIKRNSVKEYYLLMYKGGSPHRHSTG